MLQLPTILLDMNTEATNHNQNISQDLHQVKDYTTTKLTSNKTKYHLACNLLILQKYNTIVASTFYYNTTRLKINCEEILRKEQRRDRKEQRRK